jgi:heterodisulfide reductase subunit A-like polyferredoxin
LSSSPARATEHREFAEVRGRETAVEHVIGKSRYDAIVVGSGAAGSIAVKELTERGLDVLLLEAGRDIGDEDFVPQPPGRPKAMTINLPDRI